MQSTPIWKTDLENHWGLYTRTDYKLPVSTEDANKQKKEQEKNKSSKSKVAIDTPFYFNKLKQEIKGTIICTPKGYGIIQTIDQDKNSISVKVQGVVYDFDKNEVMTELPIHVIYLKESMKVEETIYLSVNSSIKEVFEKIENSLGVQEKDNIVDIKVFFQGKELEKTEETIEKLKIVPHSKFLTTYMPGKPLAVKRFTFANQGWCVASSTNYDGLAFQTSKNIRIIGIGMYPIINNENAAAVLKLYQGDSTKSDLICSQDVIVTKNVGEPDNQPVKVMLSRPYFVKAGEFFSVTMNFTVSGNSYYGSGGQNKIDGEGEVSFSFKACVGANNGTGPSSGQIPEIYYYL